METWVCHSRIIPALRNLMTKIQMQETAFQGDIPCASPSQQSPVYLPILKFRDSSG